MAGIKQGMENVQQLSAYRSLMIICLLPLPKYFFNGFVGSPAAGDQ